MDRRPAIWGGTATGGLPGTKGEGVIIGVLDTGINMDHPSFAKVGGDGFVHTNPFGSGNFKGWCNPANPNYNPAYVCNDKLVGAWDYADASRGGSAALRTPTATAATPPAPPAATIWPPAR